jgi:hypothetical protein
VHLTNAGFFSLPALYVVVCNRFISLQLPNYQLANIYAPNDRASREAFFGLASKAWPSGDVVLAGDFNSVQSPALDRLGGHRSGRPESLAL